jgi:GT2 family glycosyltransferase
MTQLMRQAGLAGATADEKLDFYAWPPPHAAAGEARRAATPFVSVIIPHYNDLAALAVCLAGLARQSWPGDRMEIIVADNNSACGLDEVRRVAAGCRVIHAPIQGAGPARNAGAAVATGDVLAFIDSDCDPAPDWIEHGVRGLAEYDFAGGHVRTTSRDPLRPSAVEAWEMEFGFNFKRHILVEGYTGTGNMWVWRRVFDAVGGFRAGISEDMDWSFRATRAGYRLGYVPDAVVSHLARPDWHELLRRWRRVIAELYVLNSEKPFGRLRWIAKTLAMPLSVAPHLVRVARSDKLPNARARLAAAGVLVAHRLWRTGVMFRLAFPFPSGDER